LDEVDALTLCVGGSEGDGLCSVGVSGSDGRGDGVDGGLSSVIIKGNS